MTALKSPFPYFGGKSKIAPMVWQRFGVVANYVEPFFGSGAVLLNRPLHFNCLETVNDKDGMIANFWRALQHDPDAVAEYADNPVNENDLHARHIWLVNQRESLTVKLEGDPHFYDAKIAGWWVWGIACWIGSGWCSGRGSWHSVDGQLVHLGNNGQGVNRQLVHLGDNGKGVNRQLVHLGNNGKGVNRKLVHLGNNGRGVNRQLVHLGDNGQGVNRKRVHLGSEWSIGVGVIAKRDSLREYFGQLADRLRNVRVCSGDWSRVTGPSVTFKHGLTAVFLDPPYTNRERADGLYTEDCGSVAAECVKWAIANGDNPLLRICVAGYEGEHDFPDSWDCVKWTAKGGYDGQNQDGDNRNKERERLWFSPHCVDLTMPLFAAKEAA